MFHCLGENGRNHASFLFSGVAASSDEGAVPPTSFCLCLQKMAATKEEHCDTDGCSFGLCVVNARLGAGKIFALSAWHLVYTCLRPYSNNRKNCDGCCGNNSTAGLFVSYFPPAFLRQFLQLFALNAAKNESHILA